MKISSDSAHVRFPPPLVLVFCIAAALMLNRIIPLPWISAPMSWAIGFVLVSDGVGLVVWSVLLFKKHKTHVAPWAPSLVIIREGPYRFSRNPIYLGFVLIALSVAFFGDTLWGFPSSLAFLAFAHFYVVAREESYLTRKFGAEYEGLKRTTRRWF